MAIFIGIPIAAAIAFSIAGEVLTERRRARRACTKWLDDRLTFAGKAGESDTLQ